MNLTRLSTDENVLRRFFVEQLVSIASKLRKDGIRFFPLGPDDRTDGPDSDSWYVPYPENTIELTEFDAGCLEEELRKLWVSQGLHQLGELAKPLADLARRLKMPAPSDDSDVSPFIYVMF